MALVALSGIEAGELAVAGEEAIAGILSTASFKQYARRFGQEAYNYVRREISDHLKELATVAVQQGTEEAKKFLTRASKEIMKDLRKGHEKFWQSRPARVRRRRRAIARALGLPAPQETRPPKKRSIDFNTMAGPPRKRMRLTDDPTSSNAIVTIGKRMPGRYVVTSEEKHVDTSDGGTSVSLINTADPLNVILLNGIGEGTGINSRNAEEALVSKISVRASVYAVDNTISPTHYRVAIILDKHPNGVPPTKADIYEGNGPREFNRLENRQRFKTLAVKTGVIGTGVGATTGGGTALAPGIKQLNFHKSFKEPIKMHFSGTGNGIGAIKHGAIFLVVSSDRIGALGVVMDWNARVRFHG